MEATGGIEPPNRGFADPRLNHLATSPFRLAPWCRGWDLNPHELTPTAPSRLRVYQFHHLGTADGNTISETGVALKGFRVGCVFTLPWMGVGFRLAGAGGFEPPATGFGDQRSGQTELRSCGTPGGIRTPDARLRKPPLYPLSYRGLWWR